MRLDTPLLHLLATNLVHAIPASQKDALPTVASKDPSIALDQLAELAKFAKDRTESTLDTSSSQKRSICTSSNLSIRREWGSLSKKERKAYISAVQCFQEKQAKTPSTLIPGAISRFDDWVGTHINQTMFHHYSGTFLGWHRYYIWAYEQALRTECGYTGSQPYWDWAKTAISGLEKSPLFDGSDTSLSGNGAYVPGNELGQISLPAAPGSNLPPLYLPTARGGGCVTSGPFKNMTINLGPVLLPLTNGSILSNGNGLTHNPRCLSRDLTDAINRLYANASAIASTILANPTIASFQLTMQGIPGSGNIGIHGGGHYSLGGDPGRDFYISPGDPAFYAHHAQIDRVWWVWQNLHPRTAFGGEGIAGTETFLDTPPSKNVTLDTMVDLGYAWKGALPMRDVMRTTGGPFCYVYL